MSYTPNPNTGTLFHNNRKMSDNHPDMRGDIYLDRSFLRNLLDKVEGDIITVSVSAWNKQSQRTGTEFLSMSISEPFVKKAEPSRYEREPQYAPGVKQSLPVEDDGDVPF